MVSYINSTRQIRHICLTLLFSTSTFYYHLYKFSVFMGGLIQLYLTRITQMLLLIYKEETQFSSIPHLLVKNSPILHDDFAEKNCTLSNLFNFSTLNSAPTPSGFGAVFSHTHSISLCIISPSYSLFL